MARIANNLSEATHRFPTSIHWGEGYIGNDNDGMRYLVADNDADALAHPRAVSAETKLMHLQRKVDGKWKFCDSPSGRGTKWFL